MTAPLPNDSSLTDLRGRVALVTGAGSGIGRATALALAEAGAKLIICDLNETGLAEVADLLKARGQLLLRERVDVADRTAMRAFAEAVHARIPAVDVLVNNAGVGLAGGLLNISLEDWDWVLSIDLGGVIHGCHFFVPKMVERRQGGHVVNIASAAGFIAEPMMIGYCTAKFGVVGMSEALRHELHPHGIGVSVICPGIINTPIVRDTRYRGGEKRDPKKTREAAMKLFEARNYPPEKVAARILDSIRKNRGLVPVTPEAWLMYVCKRAAPNLTYSVGRFLRRLTFGQSP